MEQEGSKWMKKYTDMFAKDVEVPDIVDKKMKDAFARIQTEGTMSANNFNQKKVNKANRFKYPAAAVATICVLAVGGTTAYAAYRHLWSSGMEGTLQATQEQQQQLAEEGIVTSFGGTEDYTDMAVTDGGITVTPETMVVNDKLVHLSLSVEGYTLPEGAEPCFEFVDVYVGEEEQAEDGALDMSGSFYDGTVMGEDGNRTYEDGTPVKTDKTGATVLKYTDENGKMEYVISAMVARPGESLLGKTLHVKLKNLGTVDRTTFTGDKEGQWDFTFKLSEKSSMEVINTEKALEGVPFTVTSVELSPVAIKVNYNVTGEVRIVEDDLGIPEFNGVVLEDGTEISCLKNGGMTGYADDSESEAYDVEAFNRVIDTKQVKSILLRTENGIETVDIK